MRLEKRTPEVGELLVCKLTAGTLDPIIRGKKYCVDDVDCDENGNISLHVKGSWYHSSCFNLN